MRMNRVLSCICIIVNGVITYCISSNRYVNRMPSPNSNYSFIDNLYDLFLGQGFPTILTLLITSIMLFVINKLIIKQEIKIKKYIFLAMFSINIRIYRIEIEIAV